jgi:cobalt-zinc-cadmium efflux system protein
MGHDHGGRVHDRKRLKLVLLLTSVFLLAEAAAGFASGSLALLADAGHMLSDVVGLALALFAMTFATRPPTPERTYGYHRVEILAALANSVILIVIALYILYEAYERLRNPPMVATGLMLAVAALGLVVNLVSVGLLSGGSGESLNVKAAYFEVLSDLLSSVGVIAAAGIMWVTGWFWADPLVSAGIGLFILPRTWHLLKEAVGVLLEGTPADVDLEAVRRAIESVPGVERVHDLHVWTITSGMNALSAHAAVGDGTSGPAVLASIRQSVARFKIAHVTVQIEGSDCGDPHAHV